jgi:glucose/arabinose dehydrogenase
MAVMRSFLAAGMMGILAESGLAQPDGFVVREGFSVTVAIESLPRARFLEFGDNGVLYVSRDTPGDITAFRDGDGDGKYEKLGVFTSGKSFTHGMFFRDGWLWFTTPEGVYKGRDSDGDGDADEIVDVVTGLDGKGGHWWRSIFVAEDGFYTSVGCSGNISEDLDTDRQKLWKYSLDGKSKELFCGGIRNTEKLRLRPGTTELWGLDHGSDNFGEPIGDKPGKQQPITDLNPPDEFNRYVKDGFYGHPYVTGDRLPRHEYLERPDIHALAAKTIPPAWPVGAHWATNGFCFVDPAMNQKTKALPPDWEGDAIIGCHGSWNSLKPVGYCVARIRFDHDPKLGGNPVGLEKIVSTIDEAGKVRARPVDCVQAPDGTILFSADQPGRVYRLTRTAP